MENKKLHVVVIEPYGRGGMIHYAYQLCIALAKQGATVTLITSDDYELHNFPHPFEVKPMLRLWKLYTPKPVDDTPPPLFQKLARKVFHSVRRIGRGVRFIWEWVRMTNYLIQVHPDVIQFSIVNFPFEAFFFARLQRNGLTLTQICHEFERRQRGGRLGDWLNYLYTSSYQYFSTIFFHAESNRERFLTLFNYPKSQTHLIVHGNENLFLTEAAKLAGDIDLRQRYNLTDNVPVVLFFGLLSPTKGLPELLNAFAKVVDKTNARLLIAGYPTKFFDMTEFLNLIRSLNLSDRVVVDPRYIPIEEVALLIELANFLVFPYRNSTQSGALQVAYAFGRPVIATRVGGLVDAVEDGHSGYLVPLEDVEALAEKMLLMFNNPQQTADMGRYAKQLSETHFAWEPIANKILAIYENLLKEKIH
jgi:glycosyltransferase involved in cell wall biosynthesis